MCRRRSILVYSSLSYADSSTSWDGWQGQAGGSVWDEGLYVDDFLQNIKKDQKGLLLKYSYLKSTMPEFTNLPWFSTVMPKMYFCYEGCFEHLWGHLGDWQEVSYISFGNVCKSWGEDRRLQYCHNKTKFKLKALTGYY